MNIVDICDEIDVKYSFDDVIKGVNTAIINSNKTEHPDNSNR